MLYVIKNQTLSSVWPISQINCEEKHRIFELRERYVDVSDHRSDAHNLVMKLKLEKISGLGGFQTHNLCDTGAVLYQLSYQAIWELVTLRVRNILADDEDT